MIVRPNQRVSNRCSVVPGTRSSTGPLIASAGDQRGEGPRRAGRPCESTGATSSLNRKREKGFSMRSELLVRTSLVCGGKHSSPPGMNSSAAVVLLVTQTFYELRSSEERDLVSVAYTIDRVKPEIRQWVYPEGPTRYLSTSWRERDEGIASSTLATADPKAFEGDRSKISVDFVWFSTFAYLASSQLDWRYGPRSWPSPGIALSYQRATSARDCSVVRADDLRQILSASGNLFATAASCLSCAAIHANPVRAAATMEPSARFHRC
jgi:hypothetical protein